MTSAPSKPFAPAPAPAVEDRASWITCPACRAMVYGRRLERHNQVCPECSHHLRVTAADRLELLLDRGSFERQDAERRPVDVLSFVDRKPYPERLAAAVRATGNHEAVVWGTGSVGGYPVVMAVLDFGFMGGSIGGLTGELISRAAQRALADRRPLIVVCASGGARMQEGAVSLMQLARTSQEFGRLREAGVLTVNVNTDPTYGGATASFAMLGDVVVAEPGARIGFAGPDVIRQTIRQELPAGFQTAEFLHRNGMVDLVVARDELRGVLIRLLTVHARALPVSDVATGSYLSGSDPLPEPSATEVLRLARHTGRPTTLDYCDAVFDDFVELHGDRLGADDPAVVIGVALLDGRPVAVLGHQKAHDTVEMVRRNFGMPQPAGYHKARRLMNHAERFGLPVITFVDTPGAFPGTEAEQRGQGTAIAEALLQMSRLRVPVISVITGEGGSGGALALAVGNRVVAMANSYLSVISPEGCSTILFGSAESADRAARALRITAPELLRLGVIDGVVPEPEGGAHADPVAAAAAVKSAITSCLGELTGQNGDELVDDRYARYQRFNPIETYQSAVEA